ncbi:MAG: response regulator transcription factor [Myxococcales bacterium]|nr:response regulator transcription factor [Myxococcales bacterium]
MRTLLVIDDDDRLRALLAEYLGSRGFAVLSAADGQSGLGQLRQQPVIDLIILDVMMPGMDGLEVCRDIRRTHATPIIMLTARGDDTDRIVGLELGADDYLAKPFNPRELLARIQAVLRRSTTPSSTTETTSIMNTGQLELDPDRRTVQLRGQEIEMTTTEFEILRTLMSQAGRVVSRERLMELARGTDYASFDRAVDVHISHIRRKLGDHPRHPLYVKTIRGVGYSIPKEPE